MKCPVYPQPTILQVKDQCWGRKAVLQFWLHGGGRYAAVWETSEVHSSAKWGGEAFACEASYMWKTGAICAAPGWSKEWHTLTGIIIPCPTPLSLAEDDVWVNEGEKQAGFSVYKRQKTGKAVLLNMHTYKTGVFGEREGRKQCWEEVKEHIRALTMNISTRGSVNRCKNEYMIKYLHKVLIESICMAICGLEVHDDFWWNLITDVRDGKRWMYSVYRYTGLFGEVTL